MNKPKTSFCWECGKRFVRIPSLGIIFAHILGWDGNEHDVHRACVGSQHEITEKSNHA